MKGHSVNCIPSFDSLPYLGKDYIMPDNQMMFLMSRKDLESRKSIENLCVQKLSIMQPKDQDSVSIRCVEENGQTKKQAALRTEDSFKSSHVNKKKLGCVCKKTGCLKLYCQCFRKGKMCGDECNCCKCNNVQQNIDIIQNARVTRKKRSKISSGRSSCNCKKSECQKKYCECFNIGVPCSDECKCRGCANKSHNHND